MRVSLSRIPRPSIWCRSYEDKLVLYYCSFAPTKDFTEISENFMRLWAALVYRRQSRREPWLKSWIQKYLRKKRPYFKKLEITLLGESYVCYVPATDSLILPWLGRIVIYEPMFDARPSTPYYQGSWTMDKTLPYQFYAGAQSSTISEFLHRIWLMPVVNVQLNGLNFLDGISPPMDRFPLCFCQKNQPLCKDFMGRPTPMRGEN